MDLFPWPEKQKSYLGNGMFHFLNQETDLGWPIGWDGKDLSHLWRYHPHYFDYLQQPDMTQPQGMNLMSDWALNNMPKGHAVG